MTRAEMVAKWGPEVILRCCRDWPAHLFTVTLYGGTGRCGLCHQSPTLVHLDTA
jgi:hypothetical protein